MLYNNNSSKHDIESASPQAGEAADSLAASASHHKPQAQGRQEQDPAGSLPGALTPRDRILQEFRKSAISDETALLNFEYISGEMAIETMAEVAVSQAQTVTSYATVPVAKILKRYEFAAAGGWVAYGTTIDGGKGSTAYFKPDEPRRDFEDRKLIKYETPQGCAATPLLANLPPEEWQALFAKHKATPLEGETPWQTVQRCNLPLGIVEGWKKALALADHGIASICIRGVAQWHSKGTNELWDAIAQLATSGRKIFIFFDEDEKEKTRQNVDTQRMKLAAALEQTGCSPLLPRWDMALGKGIDDVLFGLGTDAQSWLDALVKSAPSLKATRYSERLKCAAKIIKQLNTLTYPVERATEGKYMPELPPIEKGAIHVLSADMESGKTTRIGQDYVKPWIADGGIVVYLAPSNSLGKQTAETLNLSHVHDFDKTSEGLRLLHTQIGYDGGVVMCPDSQHRLPSWLFERPLLLILDEANQIDSHMAEGNTLKERFSEIWEKFGTVAQNAIVNGAIVLSEANLPDRAIDLVRKVSGATKVRVFTHKKVGVAWPTEVLKGQVSGYRAMLLNAVGDGKKLLVVTSSQKEAERIERILSDRHPDLKIFRVDSKTNREGNFDDLFRKPNEWLQAEQPDVLILSPSAKSGVDIEGNVSATDAYFDEVWGYFPSLTTDTHMQLLGRYRPPVPRVIFCPLFIQGDFNEQAAYPSAIARHMRSHTKLVGGVYGLDEMLEAEGDRAEAMLTTEQAVAEYLSAERSVAGCQKLMAHDELVRRLEAAGHNVTSQDIAKSPEAAAIWKAATEELEREDGAFMAARVVQEEHTPEWARKRLKSMECTLEVEILAQKVLLRAEFPGVAFDDPDDCYRAIYKEYGSMKRGVINQGKAENLSAAQEIDRELARSILDQNIKANHRLPRAAMRGKVLAASGILELVDGREYQNSDKRATAVKVNCLRFRKEIATYLSLNVNESQTPVEICNKLLKRLGLKAISTSRPGRRGERINRIYQAVGHDDPLRVRLLNAYRAGLAATVSSISNKETYIGITDTANNPPPDISGWLSPESLKEIKEWYEHADNCPENRGFLDSIPREVIELALAS